MLPQSRSPRAFDRVGRREELYVAGAGAVLRLIPPEGG